MKLTHNGVGEGDSSLPMTITDRIEAAREYARKNQAKVEKAIKDANVGEAPALDLPPEDWGERHWYWLWHSLRAGIDSSVQSRKNNIKRP